PSGKGDGQLRSQERRAGRREGRRHYPGAVRGVAQVSRRVSVFVVGGCRRVPVTSARPPVARPGLLPRRGWTTQPGVREYATPGCVVQPLRGKDDGAPRCEVESTNFRDAHPEPTAKMGGKERRSQELLSVPEAHTSPLISTRGLCVSLRGGANVPTTA